MFTVRRSAERGHANHGWLDTYHTFSFADYDDPGHRGFRALPVINEDRVRPGTGFGTHGHRDMEIVTWVLSGSLQHKDSLGHGAALRPGEAQRITAGTGIMHSEFNPSQDEPVHLYQIWLLPERRGLEPGYEQRAFPAEGRRGRWQLLAAPDGQGGALAIRQDVRLSVAELAPGASLAQTLAPGRHAWLQVTRGQVEAGGHALTAGDGAALSDEEAVELRTKEGAEALWFDLA